MNHNMTLIENVARDLAWHALPVAQRNRCGHRKAQYWNSLSTVARERHWKKALAFAQQLRHVDIVLVMELLKPRRLRRDYRSARKAA